jgi:hypothetical protein
MRSRHTNLRVSQIAHESTEYDTGMILMSNADRNKACELASEPISARFNGLQYFDEQIGIELRYGLYSCNSL